MRFSFAFTVVALQYIVPIAVQRGVISSAYPIMEMLTGFAFGVLADKIGRKWITVVALFVSSLVSLSFTFTHAFLLLVLIHGVQGICAGAIITGTLAALTDVAKKESRGREMGFYDFCTLGGYGLGFIFALVLIGGNVSRALLPFYVGATIALIGGIASLVLLKDQIVTVQTTFPFRENLKKIIEDRKTLTLVATWFVLMILIGTSLTYTRELFGVLLNGRNHLVLPTTTLFSTRLRALFVILSIIGIFLLAVSQTTFGSLSDRFGREKLVLVGQGSILGLMVVLVFLFAFNLNNLLAIPFLAIFGLGVLAFTPAGLAALAKLPQKLPAVLPWVFTR